LFAFSIVIFFFIIFLVKKSTLYFFRFSIIFLKNLYRKKSLKILKISIEKLNFAKKNNLKKGHKFPLIKEKVSLNTQTINIKFLKTIFP